MRHRDPRAGFTLIEVLAALVVTTAFVAVVLPYAGRLATHWWVGETTVESADAWMQAIARMSDDLAEAVPFGLDRDGKPALAFSAGDDSVSFVRRALGHADGSGELETVSYDVRPNGTGSALVRRSRRFDPQRFGRDNPETGVAAVLIAGPYRFRLVSIGVDGSRKRSWTPTEQMPIAVELSTASTGREPVPAAPVYMPIVARSGAVTPPPGAAP